MLPRPKDSSNCQMSLVPDSEYELILGQFGIKQSSAASQGLGLKVPWHQCVCRDLDVFLQMSICIAAKSPNLNELLIF